MADADNGKEELKTLAEDYRQCFRYFDKDISCPQINKFIDGDPLWLDTNFGEVRLEEISEDEITYCICRAEIQVLFDELSYTEEEILEFVNSYLKQSS